MQTIKRNKSIGLDIGQTSGKVVCLSRSGRKAAIQRMELFRLRDEGILGDSETEQFEAVAGWLKELKLLDSRVVLGLPQYMATTKVSDFAKGARGKQLAQMVGYETMQVSGISDDVFIHDFAVLPAGNGRQNPVLIGLCREANVDDLASRAENVSIQLEDMGMTGLAVANAFAQLYPAQWKEPGLQLLMDVGTESSTVVLMHSGQVLYIGGMMFGGANVTQELARQLQVTMDEAEQKKIEGQVDWASLNLAALSEENSGYAAVESTMRESLSDEYVLETSDEMDVLESMPKLGLKLPGCTAHHQASPGGSSPMQGGYGRESIQGLACFKTMIRELENCLEHWRSSELEELGAEPLKKIWICGGGAKLDQIATYLEVSQECEVEVFGPAMDKKGKIQPDFTVAYGLALQGLGLAEYSISLTPDALTWIRSKECRAKYLVASFLLLCASICGWLYYRYDSLGSSILDMDDETQEIKSNVGKLEKLDEMKTDYIETLMQAMPVVENNIQTGRFLRMLTLLQDAVKNPGVADCKNWCVYVADEESFRQHNPVPEATVGKEMELKVGQRTKKRQLLETTDEKKPDDSWQQTLEEEKKVHEVVEITTPKVFYVVGVIMSKFDNHNKIEEMIMSKLKQSHVDGSPKSPLMFSEVQLMSESERSQCKNRAVFEWENCLVNMRTSQAFKSYDHRSFFLRLTLKNPGVDIPASNPLNPVRKKGKKSHK